MEWIIGIILVVLLLIVVGLILWGLGAYNSLVRTRNQVQESWQQIDVELQRRNDLIPNLVATVKGIAGHERNTLEEVIRLRNQAASMGGGQLSPQRAQVEDQLSQAVSKLLVTVEAYPDLKSSTNFLELQRSLAETEDRIAAGRRFYNANVRNYNTRIESVPTNFIASMGKFEKANYFEVTNPEVRQAQTIDFGVMSQVGPTHSQLEAQAAGRGVIPAQTYAEAYPNGQPSAITAPSMDAAYPTNVSQPQSGYPQGAPEYNQPASGNLPFPEHADLGYQAPIEPSQIPNVPGPQVNPNLNQRTL